MQENFIKPVHVLNLLIYKVKNVSENNIQKNNLLFKNLKT